jgi:hypothetical protein
MEEDEYLAWARAQEAASAKKNVRKMIVSMTVILVLTPPLTVGYIYLKSELADLVHHSVAQTARPIEGRPSVCQPGSHEVASNSGVRCMPHG